MVRDRRSKEEQVYSCIGSALSSELPAGDRNRDTLLASSLRRFAAGLLSDCGGGFAKSGRVETRLLNVGGPRGARCTDIVFLLVEMVTSHRIALLRWCVRGCVVKGPIPEVVASLNGSALLQYGVNQILVHGLFGGVCVERVQGGVLYGLVHKNLRVVEKTVEDQHVYGHHQNWCTGVEGLCEEGLGLVILVNGLDHVEDVVFVWGVVAVAVFVVESPQRRRDRGTEGFQLIHKCRCQHSALILGYLPPFVFQSGRHLGHGYIGAA